MAQADEIRFKDFRERFATEDACRAKLFRLRFAEGFVCPKCGGREFYPIKGRNTCHGGKRGRGTEKAQVVAALSKTEQGIPLFLRLKVVPNIQTQTLQEIITAYFEKNTVVECDGYKSYLNLKDVEVRAKKYTNGDLHWLHTALSNLKNLLRGTYHGRCAKLQPYLDEFCFRFNRRMCAGQIFSRLTRAVAASGSVLS